ncbi:MAG: HAMP domain-containing histidine kinase [Pseudomonadales bacterium]|nr:HAMP domain-containing histidine kinase [Pseudomonadales bacterium]
MARSGSLLVRTNFVMALSAVAIAITSILALNTFVVEPIAKRSAADAAALLVLSAQTWVELPPQARSYFELELAESHDLIISSEVLDLHAYEQGIFFLDLLEAELEKRLGVPMTLTQGDDLVWADISMGDYTMQIGFSGSRRDIQPLYVALIIAVMGAAIVFAASLFIVQRITRPLVDTAKAATRFRGGVDFIPLPENGPEELVTLAKSFNTMAREISELLSNRTTLLAGISHDLRTPLARMRIATELLPPEVDIEWRERFERNLGVMDELIGDVLRFARGTGEHAHKVSFRVFFDELIPSLADGVKLQWNFTDEVMLDLAPGAFRRVMQNLLTNAMQHGAGEVTVMVYKHSDFIAIHIQDSGQGIPLEYRDKVFQPFFRMDSSRSQKTGGSGLGLAIVYQLCQAHGWDINVSSSPSGGADFVVSLPF